MFRVEKMMCVCVLLLITLLSVGISQEKKQPQESKQDSIKVSSIWMNDVWKRVDARIKMNRAIQVEKKGELRETGTKALPSSNEDKLYVKEKEYTLQKGEVEKAVNALQGNIAEDLYILGKCYVILGEQKKAKETFQKLIQEYSQSEWLEKAKKEVEGL